MDARMEMCKYIWNVEDGAQVEATMSVAISLNERHLVSGADDGSIRVWDMRSGLQLQATMTKHTGRVSSVATREDGGRVL